MTERLVQMHIIIITEEKKNAGITDFNSLPICIILALLFPGYIRGFQEMSLNFGNLLKK
jgi:hypothetical protein